MSNFKRFVVCGDLHGDMQDKETVQALDRFCDSYKPQIKVFAGDLWDFRALRTKASEDEKRDSMKIDFEAGLEWLHKFKPQHFLKGNHDERLWLAADKKKGPISDYAQTLIDLVESDAKKMKCQILPYDKRHGVLRLGNLKVIHGYAHGVNAARRQAQTYGSVLCFHGHSIQHATIEKIDDCVGRMGGCLCSIDMPYVTAALNALLWRNGWIYGVLSEKTGNYQVFQAERIDGVWLVANGIEKL